MEQTRITNTGFSVAEVMIAMVVLGIAITITTSTILHVVGQSEDTNVSNHAYELTRQKLLSITTGSTVVSKVGSDTPARDGITYTRSWTIDDAVSPAKATVTTTWTTTGGRDDEVSLTGYIRGDVCPDLSGANSAPDSLDIFNADGDTVTGVSPSLNITIPEGGTSGENRFVATLIGHDPDSAEGDFALPSLAAGVQNNDDFRISQNELRTAEDLEEGPYQVHITLTDCFGETTTKTFHITFTETDMLIIDDGVVSISEHVDEGAGGVQNIIPQDTIIHTMSANKDNDLIDWSIISGNTGNTFGIHDADEDAGKIFVATPSEIDYDAGDQVYTIGVRGELADLNDDATVEITVTDINETPTDITLSNTSVDFEWRSGDVVADIATEDPDIDDEYRYFLEANPDDLFNINNYTNQLTLARNPTTDELGTDVNITIRSTDRNGAGFHISRDFTMSIQNDDPCAGFSEWVDGTVDPTNGDRFVHEGYLYEAKNNPGKWDTPPGEYWFWIEVDECTP
ncbi:MAG: cadherin repeat domain-containing protein [Fibrobacterota bacterium]